MTCLPRAFYARSTIDVARALVGHRLSRNVVIEGIPRTLSGVIAETEAYGYLDDEASHAFRGRRPRNSVMFGEVGHAYVYLSYGIHHCLNVSARDSDSDAGAVLLRAVFLDSGPRTSLSLRNASNLLSGPGNLTKGFQVSLKDNGIDMTSESSPLRIEKEHLPSGPAPVVATRRIGITKAADKQWRFVYAPNLAESSLISSGTEPMWKRCQTF